MTEQKPKPESPFDGLVPGRIVHYWPTVTESRQAQQHSVRPWPAMVTAVELADEDGPPSGFVTLNVNLPAPLSIGSDPVQRRDRVPFRAGMSSDQGGCWSWMFDGQGTRYRSDPPSALPKLT